MNRHCWENGKTRANENDEIEWPKLTLPSVRGTLNGNDRNKQLRHRIPQFREDLSSPSYDHDRQKLLDRLDFPQLVETFINRKYTVRPKSNQLAVVEHFHPRSQKRDVRKSSRKQSIEIDFGRAFEQQITPPLTLGLNRVAKFTMDISKSSVDVNFERALARLLVKWKSKITHSEKKKKPSKLKGLILHERLSKKRARAKGHKICEVIVNPVQSEDISTINFDRLRIDVVPQEDGELLEKMSALTCMASTYRHVPEISIVEDNVIFSPDLQKRMENMSICIENEGELTEEENSETVVRNAGFMDLDTMRATKSLEICDEPTESVNDISVKIKPCRMPFSNKFRENRSETIVSAEMNNLLVRRYCTNAVTSNLKNCLDVFLVEMLRMQRKMYERDSDKGRNRQRYYAGIKQVGKHLKKIKFVIIATDLEKVQGKGGLDDALNDLVGTCKKYQVPYCFGFGRRKLGYFTHGKGFASCIGIVNYGGAEEKLKNVLCAVVEARNEFSRLVLGNGKTIDIDELLPKKELLPSDLIKAYLQIVASTS